MSLDKNASSQEPEKPVNAPDSLLPLDFQDLSIKSAKPMPLGKFMREESHKSEQPPIMEPTPFRGGQPAEKPTSAAPKQDGPEDRPVQPKPLPSSMGGGSVKPLSQRNSKPAPAHSPRTFSEKDHAVMKQQARIEEEQSKRDQKAPKKGTPAAHQAASRLQDSSMGGMLQAARTRASLSIPQVEDMTRIKKSYLEALETDDFDKLPPSVFVSAYIRTLSSLYNISPEDMEIVQEKLKEVATKHEVPETLIQNLEKDGQVNMAEEARVRKILIGLVCAVILLLLWGAGWYFLIKFRNARELSKATASIEASANRQQPAAATPTPAPLANPNFDPSMIDRFIFPENPTMTELKMPGSTAASAPQATTPPAKRR